MPTNIEIKAVVRDWKKARRLAEALSDGPVELIEQEDTFFVCSRGRLKLRYFTASSGELIAYYREDLPGAKSSQYQISQTRACLQNRARARCESILGCIEARGRSIPEGL